MFATCLGVMKFNVSLSKNWME